MQPHVKGSTPHQGDRATPIRQCAGRHAHSTPTSPARLLDGDLESLDPLRLKETIKHRLYEMGLFKVIGAVIFDMVQPDTAFDT